MKKEDYQGKYLISTDTICEGEVASLKDEDGLPTLFDTKEEAIKELFEDAICGIEGNEECFEEDDSYNRDEVIKEMNAILKEGDVAKMEKYLDDNPECNYYDECVVEADGFIQGRKCIVGSDADGNLQGAIIGTPINEL